MGKDRGKRRRNRRAEGVYVYFVLVCASTGERRGWVGRACLPAYLPGPGAGAGALCVCQPVRSCLHSPVALISCLHLQFA